MDTLPSMAPNLGAKKAISQVDIPQNVGSSLSRRNLGKKVKVSIVFLRHPEFPCSRNWPRWIPCIK